MDTEGYTRLVQALKHCKQVGADRYVHKTALPEALQPWIDQASSLASLSPEACNVFKFHQAQPRISLLHYPEFFTTGFPALRESWTVDLRTGQVSHRTYAAENNPPILHRKERLLRPDHPQHETFQALTQAAEAAGLFSDARIIGHRLQWEEELRARGLQVVGHELQARTEDVEEVVVARHRTALRRRGLSTPMQALWRHGYLDGAHSLFDYGCGRGDDLRALEGLGLEAHGWDPHFRPDAALQDADVVNLGFVINVIEDPRERRDALRRAYSLAREFLVVAALIGGRTAYERYRLYNDGVLTSIGTFQKYFSQAELGAYLREVLGRAPIPVAPGTYFVFQTDEAEQHFLANRRNARFRIPRPTPSVPGVAPVPSPRRRRPNRWERHPELLERFWHRCLELGRLPEAGEFAEETTLRQELGTPKRVLRYLVEQNGAEALEEARTRRMDDLGVYLALNLFERRGSFSALPAATQLDIKRFWGSYKRAIDAARQLLFSTGNPAVILQACQDAAETRLGYLHQEESLQLHTSLVRSLPAVLRVYLGCVEVLYGEVEEADLVKLHITSPKVSLMIYDDFEGQVIPNLIERVKIDLRRQSIRFFEYGEEYPPQPLYLKSRYLSPDVGGFEEQRAFDEGLIELNLFDFSDLGPPREVFDSVLKTAGLMLSGNALQPM